MRGIGALRVNVSIAGSRITGNLEVENKRVRSHEVLVA
jgi:hypothetical protein